MNHSKKLEVSEVVDNQDGMTDDPVLERRPNEATPVKKNIGTRFLTFNLEDIKILAWP